MKNPDDFSNIEIDLGANRRGELNENMMMVFAAWVQYLIEKMFRGIKVPVKVRGNRLEVGRFIDTLVGEKRYMTAVHKYGLDDPLTFKNRQLLQKSIQKFEKETGITWPIK
jgi:hypothetical protein